MSDSARRGPYAAARVISVSKGEGAMHINVEELKRQAAEYAVAHFITSGMVIGLGTGSTARYAVEAIARRLQTGQLRDIVGIPTSRATARTALRLGIPLGTLNDHPVVDVTIDGADEVDPDMNLIKGRGGALLWEKIVAAASRQEVIIVDETKRVARLGERAPLPVEVIPCGWRSTFAFLESLGAEPQLRVDPYDAGDAPYVTDEHHYILDCYFPNGIENPHELARTLKARPGVVEHGLFLNLATHVVIASTHGIEVLGETSQVF